MLRRNGRAHRATVAVVACALLGSLSGAKVNAAEPSYQDLQEQIRSLQVKVEDLQARQQVLAAERQQATVDRVLGDAERRSQLLSPEGFTAGYTSERGFVLQSADGRFLIHPWLQLQARGVINVRDDAKHAGADGDTEAGFEIRRARFAFDGNLFDPNLNYLFLWATDRHNGNVLLEEAWAQYRLPRTAITIKAGQFKGPLDHEGLISSKYHLAADRSLTVDYLGGGDNFVQGAQFGYAFSPDFHAVVALTDGFNNNNKNFQDFPTNKANYGVSGRVERKVFGNWKQYDNFTARGNTEDLLVVGGAADYTEAGHTAFLRHVVDVQYETGCGLGAYAAYLGRYGVRTTVTGGDTYDPSVRLQASYAPSGKWEPFARFDFFHLDRGEVPSSVHVNVYEFTVGVNYYLHDHAAKFTVDLNYLPNGSPIADDASDVLGTGRASGKAGFGNGGGNEFVLRAQFQLLL